MKDFLLILIMTTVFGSFIFGLVYLHISGINEKIKQAYNKGYKEGEKMSKDNINPNHYKSSTSLECIEAMEIMFGKEAVIDFCLCNAFKYIWRWKNKNGEEDLEKADWYLHKADSYTDITGYQDDAIIRMNDYITKIEEAIKEEKEGQTE